MESFGKLMSAFSASGSQLNPSANLPVEIVQIIFRQLDAHSLLNVARVSREWLNICRGDPHLRSTARRHLRREKRRAYDLVARGKPQVLKTTVKRTRTAVRTSQAASAAPAPVTFTFGATGATSGRQGIQNSGRNFGSRTAVEPKRLNTRLR